MSRRDWDDEPLEDWEDPDPDYAEDEDEAELVDCPACGEPVYEDAEQCPYCGEYIIHSTSMLSDRPSWMVALFLAGVIAVIVTCVAMF